VNGRFRPGVSGNPAKRFQPGISGNPTGRPKTFSIHQLVAEAMDDKDTRTEAVQRLRDNLKRAKTVVNTLEFAARVNREIGLNSDAPTGGVTILFQSNLRPGALGASRTRTDLLSTCAPRVAGATGRKPRHDRISEEATTAAGPFGAAPQPSRGGGEGLVVVQKGRKAG